MNERQKAVLGIVLGKVCSPNNTTELTWEQKRLLAEALNKPEASISFLGTEDKVKLLIDAISWEGFFNSKIP